MIQQRSVIHQTYWCPRYKERRQRPVQQFAKRHFDNKALTFKAPKRSKLRIVWDSLWRRAG